MQKLKSHLVSNKYPLYSSVAVCFALIVVYLIKGIEPFGSTHSILQVDLFHQYSVFLLELREKLFAGESLLYSVGDGIGMDFFGNIVNYLLSPFNIIAILLPAKYISKSITFIIMIKSMLSAFTFSYACKKITQNGCFFFANEYNKTNRTQHASQRCGPRWVF